MEHKQVKYLNDTVQSKWVFDDAIASTMNQFNYNEEQALSFLQLSLSKSKCNTAEKWIKDWKVDCFIIFIIFYLLISF
jgi:hypothetical protein